MTETKSRKSGVVGPSKEEWEMLGASIVGTARIHGLRKNGEFFMREHSVELGSIDLLSYDNTGTHTHEVGGDSVDTIIASEFYQNENVKDVYAVKKGEDLHIYLVLKQEVEDSAYNLASLQVDIQKNHKEVFIELEYSTEENTYLDDLQQDYVKVPRR